MYYWVLKFTDIAYYTADFYNFFEYHIPVSINQIQTLW